MRNESSNISVTVGTPWFTFWIFTIAFAHLTFWQGVIALVGWPYYLGDAVATMAVR